MVGGAGTGTRMLGAVAFIFLTTSNDSDGSFFAKAQSPTPAPATSATFSPVPGGSTRAPSVTMSPPGAPGGSTRAPSATLLPIPGHLAPPPAPMNTSPTTSALDTIASIPTPTTARTLPPASSGNTDDGGSSSSILEIVVIGMAIVAPLGGVMVALTRSFRDAMAHCKLRNRTRPRSSDAGVTANIESPPPQDWQQEVALEDGRGMFVAGTSANVLHSVHPSTASADLEKASTVRLGSKDGNDGARPKSAAVHSRVLGNAPPSNASLSAGEKADATLVPAADAVLDESKSGRDSAQDVGSREAAGGLGVAEAVMQGAEQLAQYSAVPGVSEAAALVVVLVNLLSDSRGNARVIEASMKRCRNFVYMLQRAAKVLEKGEDFVDEAERVAIEDVRDAVADLVDLVKTYQSKNKVAQVLASTLFKRRQEEAEAVIDRAISRLHFGPSVQVGEDVKEGLRLQPRAPEQHEALVEARRERRRRRFFQMEIPKDEVTITDELLGTGGFGSVYLCDYNGWNAAAKVLQVKLDFISDLGSGYLDDDEQHVSGLSQAALERSRKQDFLKELDAMNRLRSPYTVNLYGAVTSYEGRLILIMDLLAGGDLRTFLKNRADEPLPEGEVRRIISDVCAGMAFLQTKQIVHGDLKSANVLLDGAGRAKLGDFGTTRWTKHLNSSDLATSTTQATLHSTPHPFGWTAPEVLNAKGKSYASDVYSFGVVVWEVLSRKVPWAGESLSLEDIHMRVVLKGHRLAIPANAPADIRDVMTACWHAVPTSRPTFEKIATDLARKA